MVRHQASHHQLIRGAFRVNRGALPLAGANGCIGQRLACQRSGLTGQLSRQRATDHQIGIATNRRSEVAVIRHRQAVMSQRRNVVTRLLHAAQRQRGDDGIFRPLLRLFQNRADIARRGVMPNALGIYADAIQKIRKHRQLLRIRLFMDAIEQRQAVSLAKRATHSFAASMKSSIIISASPRSR